MHRFEGVPFSALARAPFDIIVERYVSAGSRQPRLSLVGTLSNRATTGEKNHRRASQDLSTETLARTRRRG